MKIPTLLWLEKVGEAVCLIVGLVGSRFDGDGDMLGRDATMAWQKWHWRVVRDEFYYNEKDKFVDEGIVKSPSLKNARQRALQASSASQDWWQGEWREKTFGRIAVPNSKVRLNVYTDYEKENVLILEKIETEMEVKLFDIYISRVEPRQFQHRKRPYDVSQYPLRLAFFDRDHAKLFDGYTD